MLKNLLAKIIDYNSNLTVRVRLVALTVAGLAVTMAIWGVIQLTALDRILVDQQVKRLEGVAETVSTFYQHFPTKRGIAALDSALKDHIQTDVRLARIDIFDIRRKNVDYVAGASRVQYEWPDNMVAEVSAKGKSRYVKLETESGTVAGSALSCFRRNQRFPHYCRHHCFFTCECRNHEPRPSIAVFQQCRTYCWSSFCCWD